jgi:hypothetical protein
MDILKLKRLFGRLKGIRDVLSVQNHTSKSVGDDYNTVVDNIGEIIEEDTSSFKLSGQYFYRSTGGDDTCYSDTIRDKLFQIISYLEYGFSLSENVVEIGSLYNSIQDEELKSRCSDILSAPSNFDRVINQSTQVLEDRIRKKSKSDRNLVGVNLVNRALKPEIAKSILVTSDIPEEHEGICHICRGLMIGFRNPAHHHLTDKFTREEALKFCAFVDSILQVIEKAKVQNT